MSSSLNGKIILYRYFFLSVLLHFYLRIGRSVDLCRLVIDDVRVHGLLAFEGPMR